MGWQAWCLGLGGVAVLANVWVANMWLAALAGLLIAVAGFGMIK